MLGVAALIFSAALAARLIQAQSPFPTSPTRDNSEFVPITARSSIERLQAHLKIYPNDTNAYAQLGASMLQRVRENADPSLYIQAEGAFSEALKRDSQQLDALIGMGSLALSRHEFAQALIWGEKALAVNPYRAQIYGVIGDAQVELGRYADAVQTIQKMVDTRPDIASYSRVSYLRELHGDVPGAIDAMTRAAKAGAPGAEPTLWALTYIGHLHFNMGDLKRAEEMYAAALQQQPGYAYAQAGIARVRAAQGRYDEAIAIYQSILDKLPLPQWAIELSEVYTATGKSEQALAQLDLVRAIQQLNADAAMNVDLEMALFEADHGDPAKAVALARAAYAKRPSIQGADALAWALYHAGEFDEAWTHAQEALKLGTKDALLHFHAGMIAAELEGHGGEAQRLLRTALDINPHFSVRYAPIAQMALAKLAGR
jgi:tetratricopeptide (TPR) repeat protein